MDSFDVAGPQPQPPVTRQSQALANVGLDSVPLDRPLPVVYFQAEARSNKLAEYAAALSKVEWQFQMLLRDVRQAEDTRMRGDAVDKLIVFTDNLNYNVDNIEAAYWGQGEGDG